MTGVLTHDLPVTALGAMMRRLEVALRDREWERCPVGWDVSRFMRAFRWQSESEHSHRSYEGAFGFAKSSWDAFKYRADPKAGPYPADAWIATPRQQYEVALAIWRAYGFSGWGCRGA